MYKIDQHCVLKLLFVQSIHIIILLTWNSINWSLMTMLTYKFVHIHIIEQFLTVLWLFHNSIEFILFFFHMDTHTANFLTNPSNDLNRSFNNHLFLRNINLVGRVQCSNILDGMFGWHTSHLKRESYPYLV